MEQKASTMLIAIALEHNGEWDCIYHALKNKIYAGDEMLEKAKKLQDEGKCITIMDKEYPECLKLVHKPPFVLFYEGDINLLKIGDRKRVAITTSKVSDEQTKTFLGECLNDNAYDYIVGNENFMPNHKGNKHNFIGVFACGVDCIPTNTKKQFDLVVSEYPNGVTAIPENYMFRQRIIAGLCEMLVVGECKKTSGSTQLVNQVLIQGKEVYVMPISPWTANEKELVNNELILQGALPIV